MVGAICAGAWAGEFVAVITAKPASTARFWLRLSLHPVTPTGIKPAWLIPCFNAG
ncbi:Uncharacterised protein [Vibrio cholerae]|nr:Uncharacterised protein [Vibrio cholerae]